MATNALSADVRPAKITHTRTRPADGQSSTATWEGAVAAYRAAKANDDAYTAAHIDPPLRGLPPGPIMSAATDTIPNCVWDEAQRLCEELNRAEDALMDLPSPHAAAFALKFLVAHGDGRETDCWNTMLAAEANRFAKEA